MKLRLAWVFFPLLSACASGPTGNTPQDVCHREALNDPTVRQLAVEQMGIATMSPKANFAYDRAVRNAYERCLIQRGITVHGGVEPVRPPD